MGEKETASFGALLSRYRATAGLSQEELAEQAGLSVRGVSDLERGARTRPHATTVHLLAEALHLSPDDRAILEGAARRPKGEGAQGVSSSPAPGSFLGALPARPLVGREEEVDRIRSALQAVAEGAGQLLLLVGELGVGKTRLAQEVTAQVHNPDTVPGQHAEAFLLGTGRCYQRNQQTLYLPLFEALSELVETAPASVRPACERGWASVRREVDTLVNNGADGTEAQRNFIAAVTEFVTALAAIAPTGLALDDLQWADDGTITLLQHLARATRGKRVLLVATLRDTNLSEERPLLAHALRDLARERLADRIVLRRLSAEETARLAARLMGQETVADEIAAFLYRRTKGIPRFVEGMVQALGGRLELQGEIGAGAMGRVFAAYDAQTNREVAAKLMLTRGEVDLDTLLRFQHEAAVLAKLRHPGIVEIYGSFIDEHASCIIMELLAGQSLGQLLQDGPLPLARARHLSVQVADALSYAHSQQIVHRDIKPDNVMVLPDDQVKVTDFGIARILQPDTSLGTIATTGMRMGTPLYMAPEQIEGKKVDGRTDVYALGAMLYHMVTGKPPFEGNDALTVAVQHLQEEPVPPSRVNPAIPADWDDLILKAMAKDPAKRFQSAQEMEGAIASLGQEPTSDVHEGSRIRRMLAAVGGAATALLLAGAAVWSHGAAGSGTSAEAASIRSYLSGLEQQGQFSGVALVTKPGQILLSQGYGFADREDHIRNSPQTLYPLGGLGYAISYQLALQLAEAGKISLSSHICSYISRCPSSWRAITIEMVADGTSRLPDYPWGASPTPAEYNVRHCAAMPLDTVPPGATDYGKSCDVIVLDTVIERALHRPWAALLSQYILTPAGMKHSGRLYDSLRPPARARDYSGSVPGDPSQGSSGTGAIFNVYSTAPDILRYDNALFGGKLVTAHGLQRILTPRDLVLPPDPSIKGARNGWSWHVGRLMGRRAVYTEGNLSNFYCFDLRLPQDGVTVIVLSNNSENDATEIAVNIAQFAVGKKPSLPGPPLPARAADPSRAIQTTIDAKIPGDTPALLPGSLWLSNPDVGTLTRIDTRIDAYALSVPLGTHNLSCPGCGAVTIPMTGEGQLWSADATSLVRINPRTNKVAERIPVGPGTSDLALTGHTLWVTSTGKVLRVDLRRRRVVAIVHGFANPQMIVASRDAAWVTDSWSESVKRINPATDRIVANIHVGEDPEALALGFGSLWVMNGTGGIISRVDPRTNRVSATIVVGHGVRNMYSSPWGRGVAVGFGRVWTVVHDDGKLVSIDPRTNRPVAALTIPVPPSEKTVAPYQVAVGDGSVWVYADPHYVFRIDPKAMR